MSKRNTILALIIASGLVAVHIIQIASAEPGTSDDPLVSKSYVDQKFESFSVAEELDEKLKEFSDIDDEQKKRIDELTKALNDLYEKNEQLQESLSYGKFVALELTKGQKLMTGDSAEIILRGGEATAIGGEGGGLSDITSGTGKDINTDEEVPLNHLLLVSRDDGRGVEITSKKAWVLVKGPYTIEDVE